MGHLELRLEVGYKMERSVQHLSVLVILLSRKGVDMVLVVFMLTIADHLSFEKKDSDLGDRENE